MGRVVELPVEDRVGLGTFLVEVYKIDQTFHVESVSLSGEVDGVSRTFCRSRWDLLLFLWKHM